MMYRPGVCPVYATARRPKNRMTLTEQLERMRDDVNAFAGPSGKLLLMTNPGRVLDLVDDVIVGLIELAQRMDAIEAADRDRAH